MAQAPRNIAALSRMPDMEVSSPSFNVDQPKKKLLYVAVCDPDLEVTGATVRMGAFVRHLAHYYDVTLVHMAGSGHHVDAAIAERFRDHDNRLGVTQRVRVAFSQPGYFLFSPTLYGATRRLLNHGSFDYLVADYGLAALYGTWLARHYGIPLIYSSHNVEYRMYLDLSRYDVRRAVLVPYIYWAERAACRAATLVVTISKRDRCAYTKWIRAEKIDVIPQGFDPALCHPLYAPPPSSPAVVLFVGNFRDKPTREAARQVVKEVMPAVVHARPDTTFQFIGADPPRDVTGPNVECLGFVDDLVPYWRRANVVISPMSVAHGMATKIISALAFGKIVVSTPQGAGAIPRKYRQLVVVPLDRFASTIVRFLAQPPVVHSSDFNDLCNDFGWPSLMARLYQKIEQSCASPSSV